MPLQYFFWGFYVAALFISFWSYYEPAPAVWYRRAGAFWMFWLLLGILGYQVFGSVVQHR